MIDLTPLLSDAIVVLVAICALFVLTKLVPEIKRLWQPFAEKWPMEAVFLEAQADLAVKAAEQSLKKAEGSEKLAYALDFVKRQAKRYGFSFDEAIIQTLIEAKVKELKDRAVAAAKSGQ